MQREARVLATARSRPQMGAESSRRRGEFLGAYCFGFDEAFLFDIAAATIRRSWFAASVFTNGTSILLLQL